MKFVYPEFLFALAAIAIPIIIHLFNFRKFKTVYFSNIQFLKNVKMETQSRSRLKHLLVLFSRILAISCLVLAFTQPYFPVEDQKAALKERNAVSIFVDNSFSMEAQGRTGSLLDEAKLKASEILDAYESADRFQLLTNDFEAHHQRLMNKEEFLDELEEVRITPAVKKLSDVYLRQKNALEEQQEASKDVYLISDFQKSISNIDEAKPDTAYETYFLPMIANKAGNLYIDSCWFTSPIRQINQPDNLMVRIKNISEENYTNIPVKLNINGRQKALASFSAQPGESVDVKLTFTASSTGIHQASLKITDYPITYDDVFYFTFEVAENIPVLVINGNEQSKPLNSLFGNDDYFVLHNQPERNINYAAFSNHRLIILNELKDISSGLGQELRKFVENGGNVIVLPNKEPELDNYNEFLLSVNANTYLGLDTSKVKVSSINYNSDIYANVFEKTETNIDLPAAQQYFKTSRNVRTREEKLLTLANGQNLLSRYSYGKGKLYLSAVNLDEKFGNFSRHAVFVPTFYNIALFSQPGSRLYYTLKKDNVINLPNEGYAGESVYRITQPDNQYEIIPEQRTLGAVLQIIIPEQIEEAGNYLLTAQSDTVTGLSFNYDRKESNLERLNTEELTALAERSGFTNFKIVEQQSQQLSKQLMDINQGIKLWRYFIIFALVFLGTEILLLRLLK